MSKEERKQKLIQDIQNLLNSYDDLHPTLINPSLLEFMDETSLIHIIDSLLKEKENLHNIDTQWLNQFKSEK